MIAPLQEQLHIYGYTRALTLEKTLLQLLLKTG